MAKQNRQLDVPKAKQAKIIKWDQFIPKTLLPLQKGNKAAVIMDKNGTPQLFLFDTFAFLDFISEIDERLVDRLSGTEYYSKKTNPAGWLIDEIESALPLKKEYVKSLKKAIKEANKTGWIPFQNLEAELDLL